MMNTVPWEAVLLLTVQISLLLCFSFFSFYNYLYGFASLKKTNHQRVKHSNQKVAVVIVSFNEKYVLEDTINACNELSYSNKIIILADDSTDQEVVKHLRQVAISYGCKIVKNHPFIQEIHTTNSQQSSEPIEIWESPYFVYFHRPTNVGFKAGSLQKIQQYLNTRNINLMYLLDSDWHPQKDTIERTLEVLEAKSDIAFVQTKRISFPRGMNLFQKYIAIVEEGCYYVDFEGRQNLNHPILFSGCCTLFRMKAVEQVGGFTPGHLTEDLDLTNRFWLNNWKGKYLSNVINYGEVPFTYDHYRRQQERWAAGSARALREFFWSIVKTNRLNLIEKLSVLRQNAYFTTTILTGFAIVIGMITISWIVMAWNSYAVEYYLYTLSIIGPAIILLVYWCLLSNFVEPLIMIIVKKRTYGDLLHFPLMIWYAWGVLPTYILGNLKGLFGFRLNWFRTPKYARSNPDKSSAAPLLVRLFNFGILLSLIIFYFSEGWFFGWVDIFAIILIPSFILASFK